jgi:hypothetical protein
MGTTAVKKSSRPARASARGIAPMSARLRPAGAGRDSGQTASAPQPAGLVFRTGGGDLRHAWCGQPLEYHGRRARLELDFYCRRCLEHVTLPSCLLSSVPVVPGGVSRQAVSGAAGVGVGQPGLPG